MVSPIEVKYTCSPFLKNTPSINRYVQVYNGNVLFGYFNYFNKLIYVYKYLAELK